MIRDGFDSCLEALQMVRFFEHDPGLFYIAAGSLRLNLDPDDASVGVRYAMMS
jgi:hypothetical protein